MAWSMTTFKTEHNVVVCSTHSSFFGVIVAFVCATTAKQQASLDRRRDAIAIPPSMEPLLELLLLFPSHHSMAGTKFDRDRNQPQRHARPFGLRTYRTVTANRREKIQDLGTVRKSQTLDSRNGSIHKISSKHLNDKLVLSFTSNYKL